MKKTYVKPEVYFESFQLSANIAANCTLISHHSDSSCPILDPDLGKTTYTDMLCDYSPPDENDGVCYHPPAPTMGVFTS